MQSNPTESAPDKLSGERQISWKFGDSAETRPSTPRAWRRFAAHTAVFVAAGSAIMFVPLTLSHWARQAGQEPFSLAHKTPNAVQPTPENPFNSPAVAVEHQLAFEQERQRGEVLSHHLASARADLADLMARVTALTDAKTEAEKALKAAQATGSEPKLALDQERQRSDTLTRELASAREELEARKAAADAADAAAKDALALTEERAQAAEQERQRAEAVVHQLASARVELATLRAQVTALTGAQNEAAKALQAAEVSGDEQKRLLEQERQRGDTLIRELASARKEIEARKAATTTTDASGRNFRTGSVTMVSTRPQKDARPRSGRSIATLAALPAPQQRPELLPPASTKSDRPSQVNRSGQIKGDLSHQRPARDLTGRRAEATSRQNYSSIRLFGD